MRKSVFFILFICFNISLFSQWNTSVDVSSNAYFTNRAPISEVNGHPAMVYVTTLNAPANHTRLMYVRANDPDGSAWGTPIQLFQFQGGSLYFDLEVVDGNPAVVCSHDNVKYIRANDVNGDTWGASQDLSPSGFTADVNLIVSDGRPLVSYSSNQGVLKYNHAANPEGSVWLGENIISNTTPTGGGGNYYPSMITINQATAISYRDPGSKDLKYTRANNPPWPSPTLSWSTPITIDSNTDVGAFSSLAVVNQYPAISYVDETLGKIKFVRANDMDGTSWGTPIYIDDTNNNPSVLGGYSILTVIGGKPAIFYYDTYGYLRLVRANDADGTSWGYPHVIDECGWSASFAMINGKPAISSFCSNYYSGNTIHYTQSDVSVPSSIVYVDASATGANNGQSWQDAFNDLQNALAMGSNLSIRIAEGTYKPTTTANRGIAFQLSNSVSITGGYESGGANRNPELYPTILSGDINNDGLPKANSLHVVKVANAINVELDGLTITEGNANKPGYYSKEKGGGVYTNNAIVNINNCKIIDNIAIYGGGLFAANSQDVSLNNSILSGNKAQYGSGIYHVANSSVYIRNSRIINNTSSKRGAIETQNTTHTLIENSVVANNGSSWTNALALFAVNSSQTCEIRNSTILGDGDDDFIAILRANTGQQLDVNVYNSIIAHQDVNHTKGIKITNSNILNLNTENCYLQGSSVYGNATNNLYSDIDGDLLLNSDYSLSLCSPAVDAGNDALAAGLSKDINGNPRFYNTIDIGAYEGQSTTDCNGGNGGEIGRISQVQKTMKLFPNPSDSYINIEFEMDMDSHVNIIIRDVMGRIVQEQNSFYLKEQNIERIDISRLDKGYYLISIHNGMEIETMKFFKS